MTKKATEKVEAEEVAGPKPRLTTRQWAEAEALYSLGDASLAALAKKFGVQLQTVFQHMKRKGVKRGSKAEEHHKRVVEDVQKAAITDASVMAARIKETKEDHYKMAAGLAKLTWNEILKTKQDGVPVAAAMNNLKALDSAMSVLKKAREERYAVLGLDREDFVDEDGLPELVISELTADQVEQLRATRDDSFDDLPTDPIQGGDDDVVVEESK